MQRVCPRLSGLLMRECFRLIAPGPTAASTFRDDLNIQARCRHGWPSVTCRSRMPSHCASISSATYASKAIKTSWRQEAMPLIASWSRHSAGEPYSRRRYGTASASGYGYGSDGSAHKSSRGVGASYHDINEELGSIFGEPLIGGLMDSLSSPGAPAPSGKIAGMTPSPQTRHSPDNQALPLGAHSESAELDGADAWNTRHPRWPPTTSQGTQREPADWGEGTGYQNPPEGLSLDASMGAGVAAMLPQPSATTRSSTFPSTLSPTLSPSQGVGLPGAKQGQPSPAGPSRPQLTHVDTTGRATMVDVGAKQPTRRVAVASGRVLLGPEAFALVEANRVAKGDVLTVAQIAGIGGAKSTSTLIPLCHPLPLSSVKVQLSLVREECAVAIEAEVATTGPTGVEMEALTAVSVAALAVYDMCKAVSKGIQITDIQLESKTGGKSGEWFRGQRVGATAEGVRGQVEGAVPGGGHGGLGASSGFGGDLRSEDSWAPQFGHAK